MNSLHKEFGMKTRLTLTQLTEGKYSVTIYRIHIEKYD